MTDEEEEGGGELVPSSNAALQRTGTEPLLDRQAIAKLLDVPYGQLRQMLDATGVAAWVGAVRAEKGRGDRFPHAAVERLRSLMDARKKGLVSPTTAANWIANFDPAGGLMRQSSNAAMQPSDAGLAGVIMQQRDNAALLQRFIDTMQEHSAALRQNTRALPPVDDELLTAAQVTTLLKTKSAAPVKHLAVKVGRYTRWRRNDVLRFIAALPQNNKGEG